MRGKTILMFSLLFAYPPAYAQETPGALPAPPLWLASFPPFAVLPIFPPQVVWPIPPVFLMPSLPAGGWPLPFPFPAFLLQQTPGAPASAEAAPRQAAALPGQTPSSVAPLPAADGPKAAPVLPPETPQPMPTAVPSPPASVAPVLVPVAVDATSDKPVAEARGLERVPVAVPLPRLDPPPGAGTARPAVQSPKTAKTVASLAGRKAAAPGKPSAAGTSTKPAKRRLCWKNGMVDACP